MNFTTTIASRRQNQLDRMRKNLGISVGGPTQAQPEPIDTMPPKERFRVICEENIPYIRNIDLPTITKNNPLEAVLIEYRCFPHLEFLIRNAIIKLGDKWSHTVVCGNLNYDFMVTMCTNISPEIKVIKTDYDNLNQSTYSLLLASKAFWELFAGEKILLYQEDSCIFKSNVDDFLQWDYIGAPWPKHKNDTPNCVGNGGFSLRTRQCMNDVIDRVSIHDTQIANSTREYMQNAGMAICPEDVYFSKNMQDYGIGKVADWDSASAFSTESIYNGDSFGGHNFWLSDEKWKEKIYAPPTLKCDKNVIIYVICHNIENLNNSYEIYKKYTWAKPILLNNNDYQFENSFWTQLYEYYEEWKDYNMVGTLSFSSFKKINLDTVDNIIVQKLYFPNSYYHFFTFNITIPSIFTDKHPFFNSIWENVLNKLHLYSTNEAFCNYWMCKPLLMLNFINWYNNICKPLLTSEPYIFNDAQYYQGNLSSDKLIDLWGKPYYPHYPFIVERLNHIYFTNKYKVVFLISHISSVTKQNENTGAPIVLRTLQKYYEQHGIKVIFHYLDEVYNIDIVKYIKTQSCYLNCSPIVICNTLVCGSIVKQLSNSNISTYWYIHEWYEPNSFNSEFGKYLYLFNSDIKIIFICNAQYQHYLKYTRVKNYVVINNGLDMDILLTKMNEIPEKKVNIYPDDFIISIIGTVDSRKNQQQFIDNVFYNCKKMYPKIKLLLVGSINTHLCIQSEYANSIIQIGNVNNAVPYIKLSDIIVSYSINEVFPLNIMESFFCKKCVIASNVGGTNELIHDNYNGFLFKKNDNLECFTKLCKLIEQEDLRTVFAENAKKEIEKYDDKTTFKQFLCLIGV